MNQLLDTIGAFLYLGFCLVVFPVLLLARLFVWTLIFSKHLRVTSRALRITLAKKPLFRFPVNLEMGLGRMRLKLHR